MDKGVFDYARYGSIGISWVVSSVIYVYLGFRAGGWLDQRFGTAPLFLAGGLVAAIALSFWSLLEQLLRLERGRQGKRPPKKDDPACDDCHGPPEGKSGKKD